MTEDLKGTALGCRFMDDEVDGEPGTYHHPVSINGTQHQIGNSKE
jgi:hypothetical protein